MGKKWLLVLAAGTIMWKKKFGFARGAFGPEVKVRS